MPLRREGDGDTDSRKNESNNDIHDDACFTSLRHLGNVMGIDDMNRVNITCCRFSKSIVIVNVSDSICAIILADCHLECDIGEYR